METLDDRIARDGPIKELDAVGWAIRLAKRLEALHSLGVAHGSVSPACILTSGADRTSRAYIADVQLTTSRLAFQSPERILGGDLSPADDAWAVACTLYMALTGTSPFVGGNDVETRQKILTGSPAPLAVFDVGDDDLQHILDGALTREIAGRTSTVTALRSALEEWHPDPGVGALSPLDDDDASEGDEDMRTVMRPAPAFITEGRKPAPAPAPTSHDDDDDEDEQATKMREFKLPPGFAASSPFGNSAPFAPAAGREAAPRPAAGRSTEAMPAFSGPAVAQSPFGAPGLHPGPGMKAPAIGPGAAAPFGAAVPRRVVAADADDDDNDNDSARTMMRASPIDESAHPSGLRVAQAADDDDDDDDDGARTMMREPGAWDNSAVIAPGAPRFGGAPAGPAPGWPNDPVPAKTMALAAFDFPHENMPPPGAGAFPRTPGSPATVGFGALPEPMPQGPGAAPGMNAPYAQGPAVAPFQPSPQAGPMMPMGQPAPLAAAAAAAASSRRIVILTAAIALLIIAATTFVVLLIRGVK